MYMHQTDKGVDVDTGKGVYAKAYERFDGTIEGKPYQWDVAYKDVDGNEGVKAFNGPNAREDAAAFAAEVLANAPA